MRHVVSCRFVVHVVVALSCVAFSPFGFADAAFADEAAPAVVERKRLLVLELTGDTVPQAERKTLSNLVGIEVANAVELDVVTTQELEKLITMERDKQLLGCLDASCLAEVADAMGTDLIIFGEIGKLGSTYILTLSLFDSNSARAAERDVVKASSLDGVVEALGGTVAKLTANVGKAGDATEARLAGGDSDVVKSSVAGEGGDPASSSGSSGAANNRTDGSNSDQGTGGAGGERPPREASEFNYISLGGWGLVGLGALVAVSSLTLDAIAESSRDYDVTFEDWAYAGATLSGVGIAAGGLAMALLPGLLAGGGDE